MIRPALACLLAFACAAVATAAPTAVPVAVPTTAPVPADRYVDDDSSAVAILPRPGNRTEMRHRLDAALRADPRNVLALTHRAHFHYAGGHAKEGERDYARALELTVPGGEAHRHVLWSWGWALFDAGDAAGALERWHASEAQAAPAHPFWVPYTVALAYWSVGQRDTAVAYFDAAVRSNPKWGTAEGRAERIAKWRDNQKAVIAEIAAAWEAQRAPAAAR